MNFSHLQKKLYSSHWGDLQSPAQQGRAPPERGPHCGLTWRTGNAADSPPCEESSFSLEEKGRHREERGMGRAKRGWNGPEPDRWIEKENYGEKEKQGSEVVLCWRMVREGQQREVWSGPSDRYGSTSVREENTVLKPQGFRRVHKVKLVIPAKVWKYDGKPETIWLRFDYYYITFFQYLPAV